MKTHTIWLSFLTLFFLVGPNVLAKDSNEKRLEAEKEAIKTKSEAEKEAYQKRQEAEMEAMKKKYEAEKEAQKIRMEAEKDAREARADAEGSSEGSVSTRSNDRLGAYLSLWGDPYPAPLGVNLAYNVTDFLRVNAGVGSNDEKKMNISTFGVGAKAMIPTWRFTPVVGINISMSKSNSGGTQSIRGFDPEGTRVYGTAGLDWQTRIGLNLAAGYAQSLRSGEDGTVFLNVGFFL